MNQNSDSGERGRVGGIVLCGGASRRMGRAKEWLAFGPECLLQRVVRLTSQVVNPVVVAARPQQSLPPLSSAVRIVYDNVADRGPLAGLAAGFAALDDCCQTAFVTTCDQPFIKPDFITRLIARLNGHPALVPQHGGWSYPLTAVYRIHTQSILMDMLMEPDRSAHRFAQRCGAAYVLSEEFRDVDPNLNVFCNLNDPQDYERALRACGHG